MPPSLQCPFVYHRLLGVFLCFSLCVGISVPVYADELAGSLYARLGGQAVINTISAQLIDQTSGDPALKRSFKGTDLPRLKALLAEQICALANGPCKYSGDTMKEVHAGLDIKQNEFYGMVELLRQIMIKNGVGLTERNELLALLAPMKRDVVTK